MTDLDLPAINAALAQQMRERLGIRRGALLEEKLNYAGRLVPSDVRQHGARLVAAERLWDSPKLRRQVDPVAIAFAEAEVRAWLESINRADRRTGVILGILASLAFNFMLLAVIVIAYLAWIGWL